MLIKIRNVSTDYQFFVNSIQGTVSRLRGLDKSTACEHTCCEMQKYIIITCTWFVLPLVLGVLADLIAITSSIFQVGGRWAQLHAFYGDYIQMLTLWSVLLYNFVVCVSQRLDHQPRCSDAPLVPYSTQHHSCIALYNPVLPWSADYSRYCQP